MSLLPAASKEAFYYSTLSSSLLFEQFSMQKGFRVFSNRAAMSAAKQQVLFDCIWNDLCKEADDMSFKNVLRAWHSNVCLPSSNHTSQPLTILAFLHLISQSLVDEHV